MSFLLRSIRSDDLEGLFSLTKQFTLLNLPHDRDVLRAKIQRSLRSFKNELEKDEAEYLFVIEDIERGQLVGSSLILAKHGTEDSPHHFFRLTKRNHFSQDLGIGFIHQVLKFHSDTNGPTEIGGLLIDGQYRRRPEKLGRQISLVRFLFMGMEPTRFEEKVLCELSPPLTSDGRSEFWEALGRRFTGLPYQEADLLSQKNKEFINSLFPPVEIYLSLLDAKARIVVGQVAEDTKPAQHLLTTLGFKYLDEVDPFDGGPHYGVNMKDIPLIKNGQWGSLKYLLDGNFDRMGFISSFQSGEFRGVYSPFAIDKGLISIPLHVQKVFDVAAGQKVFCSYL